MHLANYALHAVAARSARMQDPRMRSLRSVGHLQVQQTDELRIGSIMGSQFLAVYGQAILQEPAKAISHVMWKYFMHCRLQLTAPWTAAHKVPASIF